MKAFVLSLVFTFCFRIAMTCTPPRISGLEVCPSFPEHEQRPEELETATDPDPSDSFRVIDNFLDFYHAYGQFWNLRLAQIVQGICEDFIQRETIQALVTHRAKELVSLKRKIYHRNLVIGGYGSYQHIKDDIIDLAGVRIALYIPQHKARVDHFIRQRFHILDGGVIEHRKGHDKCGAHYSTVYPGYHATHYRVRITERDLQDPIRTTKDAVVEIQVVTILHHIWANAQHDIEYKALGGSPSEDEIRMMDLLNGLMQLGEKHLVQLHEVNIKRIAFDDQPFASKWELASWLSNWLSGKMSAGRVNLGPVEVLRRFLSTDAVGKDTPKAMRSEIERMGFGDPLSPELLRISRKFDPPETRASVLIIAHLLWGTWDDGGMRYNINSSHHSSTYPQKVHVMASTILWLDDLFQPVSQWEKALTEQSRTECSSQALRWLLTSIQPRRIISQEIEAFDDDRYMIDGLWDWFDQHTVAPITLAFSISRLGVLRDLPGEEDFTKLEKIHYLLDPFL